MELKEFQKKFSFIHGIYGKKPSGYGFGFYSRNQDRFEIGDKIPTKFENAIIEKLSNWIIEDIVETNNTRFFISFTIATHKDTGIMGLSITHPNDNFSRKEGRKHAMKRITEALTKIKNCSYVTIPKQTRSE